MADTAPDTLLCNDETNPIDVLATPVPYFSAIYRSVYAYAYASYYQIQVNVNSDFSGEHTWDSGKTELGTSSPKNTRCEDTWWGVGPPAEDGTKYYWRIRFWMIADSPDIETEWSEEEAYFVMKKGAPIISLIG